MELTPIYDALKTGKPAAKVIGSLRIRELFPRKRIGLFAGVRTTTGRKLVLLRYVGDASPGGRLPKCQGFETRIATYDEALDSTSWLELEERGTGNSPQFSAMVSDVIERVHTASPAGRQSAFLETVKRWKDAFASAEAGYLSLSEQAGLYAELYFLGTVLLPATPDKASAIRAWTGPEGASKDFQFPTCAIEAKTCRSPKEEKITIAHPSQLHTPDGRPLYIFYLLLDEVRHGGEKLSARIDAIRDGLKGNPALHAFETRLRRARYRGAHRSIYDRRSYILRASAYFEVSDGFPCIQQHDIKPGMSEIVYSLQIGALSHFRVSEAEILKSLKGPNHAMQRTGSAVSLATSHRHRPSQPAGRRLPNSGGR
jgi:hypothetical protein